MVSVMGWRANCRSNTFQIARFSVCEHLHQSYNISKIMIPSSLKLRIVAVIEPKEYCNLKNKFWNALKKSPRSALADLQLKLDCEPADFPRRVIYCEWLLQQCREHPNFFNCILCTDAARFSNADFNSHNTHIWSYENPHARQKVQFQRDFP